MIDEFLFAVFVRKQKSRFEPWTWREREREEIFKCMFDPLQTWRYEWIKIWKIWIGSLMNQLDIRSVQWFYVWNMLWLLIRIRCNNHERGRTFNKRIEWIITVGFTSTTYHISKRQISFLFLHLFPHVFAHIFYVTSVPI